MSSRFGGGTPGPPLPKPAKALGVPLDGNEGTDHLEGRLRDTGNVISIDELPMDDIAYWLANRPPDKASFPKAGIPMTSLAMAPQLHKGRTANLLLANSVFTSVPFTQDLAGGFTTAYFDPDTGGVSTFFPRYSGLYAVAGGVVWEANTVGSRDFAIRSLDRVGNVTEWITGARGAPDPTAGVDTVQTAAGIARIPGRTGSLFAGGFVPWGLNILALQASGGNLNILPSSPGIGIPTNLRAVFLSHYVTANAGAGSAIP